ncbi:unannotated protein [freshwater metagenome]|uniref:Unannotated protein n=1 Tax=freshwater metagenome TaxID=449393 RepID=A0A6J6F136_9ZZZZ
MREDAVFETNHEHARELKALRRVQRHKNNSGIVVIERVSVGNETHLFKKFIHRTKVARGTNKFSKVFNASFGLDSVFDFEFFDVARTLQRRFDDSRWTALDKQHQFVHELQE